MFQLSCDHLLASNWIIATTPSAGCLKCIVFYFLGCILQVLLIEHLIDPHQAIEYVDLPVKYLNEDGRIVVCTEPWPIIDVHSIMHFLIEEAGVEIPASDIRNYWARSKEHGERWAQDESNHHRVPIGLYGDGAKAKTAFGSENMVSVFANIVLWRPKSVRWSRFLLCCVPEERCTSETLPAILRRIVWSCNHAWYGRFPTQGYRGQRLRGKGSSLAGAPLTTQGHKFQVVELRGDWQWHKKVFKFWECQWNSVKTMCPFCNAKGQSDNPSELYWNLDEPIYEFNLVEFLSQRMPPRGVCTLIDCWFLICWFHCLALHFSMDKLQCQMTNCSGHWLVQWQRCHDRWLNSLGGIRYLQTFNLQASNRGQAGHSAAKQ